MVAIAPEVFDLTLAGIGIMDSHAKAGVRIAFGKRFFIVAATTQGGLQIVFADPTGDGTRVEADLFAFQPSESNQAAGQFNADVLEVRMSSTRQKCTETLEAGRLLIRVEPECRQDRRILHQMGVKLPEKTLSAQSLINASLQEAETVCGASSCFVKPFIRPRGEELKKRFPSQPWREMFWPNQFELFYHTPEFCERCAKSKGNRRKKSHGLGDVVFFFNKTYEFHRYRFHKTQNPLNRPLKQAKMGFKMGRNGNNEGGRLRKLL